MVTKVFGLDQYPAYVGTLLCSVYGAETFKQNICVPTHGAETVFLSLN